MELIIDQLFRVLKPEDMVFVMMSACLVDLWTVVKIILSGGKSFSSQKLIRGFVNDLQAIIIPVLGIYSQQLGVASSVVNIVSFVTMLIYLTGTLGSALANYSTLYPEDKNVFTRFAYKYLTHEISEKLKKYNIAKSDDNG